ncbi:MAG: efflux RND transporter periplasmic adaptor subunit [Proteobacteria bacterium]|nr:efflux RND transporter periplasmic adaptor subunit [Pseudomonadota bacterium]
MSDEQKDSSPRIALIGIGAALVALAIGAGGYWLGATYTAPAPAAQSESRAILYWYDPMAPDQHFDHPGKSPMGMDMVPRYADDASAQTGVRIDPGVAQNFGIRYATVEREPLTQTVTAAGLIAFDERNLAIVQARASGFVERGYGRAVGDVVAAGAPIVDIRVPEWTAAQAEYLALRGAGGDLAAAARTRLAMLGMPASLIARVEREGTPRPVATITAPIAGAITALDIRLGMTMTPGAALASINGVSTVWLVVSLPQADASIAQRGGRVRARVPAYPGETFNGEIESVLPTADAATRSVQARVVLPNPNQRLRPGMTAEAEIAGPRTRSVLLAPAEAVIQTGRRTVVIVTLDNGHFAPTEIEIGRREGDRIEIVRGLSEGQRVVASGQFLIDSEASLSGALDRLEAGAPAADNAPANAPPAYDGAGRIEALDAQTVTIAHGPIAGINWPAMSMQFAFARPQQARGLLVGDAVTFRFRQQDDRYVLVEIRKTGGHP